MPVSTLVYGTRTPVDVLALAAHPDDVELCAGGTVCRLVEQGRTVAVVDFTRGELGSRGTPELRIEESRAASVILGLTARENLGLPDGDLQSTKENQLAVIRAVRRYRPRIVLANAPECRHPDHPAAAKLATDALFYGGLRMVETAEDDGAAQTPHRPDHVLHYMQSVPFTPTLVVDVSAAWAQRTRALLAYASQFDGTGYEAKPEETATFIANPDFMAFVEAQARTYGYRTGATFGEPFLYRHGPLGVDDLFAALAKEKAFK